MTSPYAFVHELREITQKCERMCHQFIFSTNFIRSTCNLYICKGVVK